MNFLVRQLHNVLYAVSKIDKTDAVILEPERREGGELLDHCLFVGAFVGKARKDDLRRG